MQGEPGKDGAAGIPGPAGPPGVPGVCRTSPLARGDMPSGKISQIKIS